jgi:PadR family transcriptional regulator, regulatory protein AphA
VIDNRGQRRYVPWSAMTRTRPGHALTTTEYALLGMLARYGEHSGYELLKLAEGGIGFFWSPAKSHVYDVLPRLARGRYARRRVVVQSSKPDRHVWRITQRGVVALRGWIDTIDEDPLEQRGVLLLKLFLGDHGHPDSLVAHMERFREQAAAKLATLREVQAATPVTEHDQLPLMTLRQGLTGTAAQLRWAEEILPELRARAEVRAQPDDGRPPKRRQPQRARPSSPPSI